MSKISKDVYDHNEYVLKALTLAIEEGTYDKYFSGMDAVEKMMKKVVACKVEYEIAEKATALVKEVIFGGKNVS